MNNLAILASNLAQLRSARKISQRALANAAQTTQQTINEIENKRANPRLSTLTKIADALNIELTQLFSPNLQTDASGKVIFP